MKKLYSLFAAVIVASSINAQISTQVVNETFSFTGALNANGWTTHSGTGGQILADGSVAKLVAGNSEDINRAFSTSYTVEVAKKNEVNYSATINIASATGISSSGDYFLMLASTSGATATIFFARLFVKGSVNGYTLGILNNSGGTATPTYGTEIPYGTPANVTVTYSIDNTLATPTNIASLKINAQALVINSTGTGNIPVTLASVVLRESGTASSGTGNITIDNLIVNTVKFNTLAVSDLRKVKNNLVKNTLVKDLLHFNAKSDIQIINMAGEVVKEAKVDQNASLNVSGLEKGFYIVNGVVNGEKSSQKIIIN